MRLLGGILALFGISLLMMIGILGRLRQSPSTAAWITFVTSHNQVNFYQNRVNPNGTQLTTFTDTATYPYPLGWSSDGRSFLFSSYGDERGLYRMNLDGSSRRFIGNFGIVSSADWSPDGEWIVYSRTFSDEDFRLYKVRVDGSEETPLSQERRMDSSPQWSPDGKWIVYSTYRRDGDEWWESIYRMRSDGSDDTLITPISEYWSFPYPAWSPDGEWIAFQGKNEEGPDLYKIRPDGRDLTLLVDVPNGFAQHPSWSPDGNWIAFFHRAFGSGASMPSIYRVRTDGSDLRMVIEDDYIQGYPQWSPAVEKEWTIGQLALVGAGLLIPILWRQKDRVY